MVKRPAATARRQEASAARQLPHLDTFAKTAELGSFTAAGRELRVTQAAVSQRIASLESSLGVSLFQRHGGRVSLTAAGKRLYDFAQRILALHAEAREQIAGEHAPLTGDLTLAASTVPGEHLLPSLLALFARRHPSVRIKAGISDSMNVIDQVQRGEVHLGLVGRQTDHSDLEFVHFATDHMVLAVPADHPLGGQERVSLAALCQQPLILREPGSGLRHCFEKSLHKRGKSLKDFNVVLELGSNEAIKEAILRRIGVAIVSSHVVRQEVQTHRLRALEVAGLDCDRPIFLVWDGRRIMPAPARQFRLLVQSGQVAPA